MNEAENNPTGTPTDATSTEMRKGFSPVLVFLTVAVVLFVLWFCPKAINWAWRQGAPTAVNK